ncbi:uncharacterized protein EV154DRAFT_426813 [Mucor mucedo]|uniref:uncharacterized protein n=2 Tax=Mucor mucedo TaxID=29922 RepID=UPI002220A3B9|nr:uncharacterized protein EV154DRAFT_426813 [Mucor mucedo]KAI7887823.1 hypothetical protein EV154DRAFT_426813 [Mucor mucedo]
MQAIHQIGANNSGFDKFLTLRFYKTFVRPVFEYGLSIINTTKKTFKLLEKAQDNAIRKIFHGHATSSTQAIKHMNKIATMEERKMVLQAKNIYRTFQLPNTTLIYTMLRQVITTRDTHFKKLQKRNEIWQSLPLPPANSRTLPIFITEKLLREAINKYLKKNMIQKQCEQFYVGMCRSNIANDPIMYLPMHNFERSRIIRWRMGWLPGRPTTCKNCDTTLNNNTTRNHLTQCLKLHQILQVPIIVTSPIDYILNQLPTKQTSNRIKQNYFIQKWIQITKIFNKIETLCHTTEDEMNPDPEDISPLIHWLKPPTAN